MTGKLVQESVTPFGSVAEAITESCKKNRKHIGRLTGSHPDLNGIWKSESVTVFVVFRLTFTPKLTNDQQDFVCVIISTDQILETKPDNDATALTILAFCKATLH